MAKRRPVCIHLPLIVIMSFRCPPVLFGQQINQSINQEDEDGCQCMATKRGDQNYTTPTQQSTSAPIPRPKCCMVMSQWPCHMVRGHLAPTCHSSYALEEATCPPQSANQSLNAWCSQSKTGGHIQVKTCNLEVHQPQGQHGAWPGLVRVSNFYSLIRKSISTKFTKDEHH